MGPQITSTLTKIIKRLSPPESRPYGWGYQTRKTSKAANTATNIEARK
jgi:hypothetical protein